jgi:hypothetical protein
VVIAFVACIEWSDFSAIISGEEAHALMAEVGIRNKEYI